MQHLHIPTTSQVLFIYPHPDDETFATAGLIQHLVSVGAKVTVLCLTKGEASTLKFGLGNGQRLEQVRQQEFEAVMKFLGVGSFEMGDFPDGKLKENATKVANYIETKILQANPTHLITFEPSGLYGHPDHVVVSKVVTDLSHKHNLKLIYATIEKGHRFSDAALNMAEDKNAVRPIEPNAKLTLSWAKYLKKLKTLKMYKSQVSLKHEPLHTLMHMLKAKTEWFFEI